MAVSVADSFLRSRDLAIENPGLTRATDVVGRIRRFDNRACEAYCRIYRYVEVTLTLVIAFRKFYGQVSGREIFAMGNVQHAFFPLLHGIANFSRKSSTGERKRRWGARYRA